jgi:hypothetical protein
MEHGISDIQKTKDDDVEITFCIYPSGDDFLKLTIDKETAWEIADFCKDKLSYGAQLKENKG